MTWWAWLLIGWGVALLAMMAFVRGAAHAGHVSDIMTADALRESTQPLEPASPTSLPPTG